MNALALDRLQDRLAELPSQVQRRMAAVGVAEEFLRAELGQLDPDLLSRIRPYLDTLLASPAHRPAGGFRLFGKTGRGKTHAMAAVCRAWSMHAGRRALELNGLLVGSWYPTWANWQRTLARLRGLVRQGGPAFENEMEDLCRAPLLVIDDLGAEQAPKGPSGAEWSVAEVLGPLLDARHGAQRATLWSSNLGPVQLVDRYESRIVSRLLGMAPAIEMPVHLPDRRIERGL